MRPLVRVVRAAVADRQRRRRIRQYQLQRNVLADNTPARWDRW